MKIIFMGTPDFAVGTLEEIIKAGHEVALVVTQPDKPKGRKGLLQAPPVKELAEKEGIPVFQPKRVREPEAVETLRKVGADMIVVAAFGQILPKEILEMPRFGCINVHASLLPKYRGAAPIQWAVINGDPTAGVTIMKMDIGLDTGDMIRKAEIPLDPEETAGSLFDKLAQVGAKLCVETMVSIENGTATYEKQPEEEATHVSMISKEMGLLDWSKSATSLECFIRGMNPWPSAYTHVDGKTLKIWKAKVLDGNNPEKIGCVTEIGKQTFTVQTGEGKLEILEVQLEGKKRMDAGSFLRGYTLTEGTLLQ